MCEFKALGRMDGHEPHLVLHLVHRVGVREQGNMRQVVLERHLLPARRLKLVDGLLQLSQVVEPLLAALSAQRALVAAFRQHGRQNLRHRPSLV